MPKVLINPHPNKNSPTDPCRGFPIIPDNARAVVEDILYAIEQNPKDSEANKFYFNLLRTILDANRVTQTAVVTLWEKEAASSCVYCTLAAVSQPGRRGDTYLMQDTPEAHRTLFLDVVQFSIDHVVGLN